MRRQNMRRIHITENELRHRYIDLEQSTVEVGDQIGCSAPIIKARLKEYGIPVRSLKEALNTSRSLSEKSRRMIGCTINIGRYKFVIDKKELYHRYVELRQSTPDIAKDIGCTKRTVLQRLAKYQIPIRSSREAHNTRNFLAKFETEIPEADLRNLYVTRQIGGREIGKLYKCSANCVLRNLRRYSIPVRTRKEAQATPACLVGRAKAIVKSCTQEARERRRQLNIERYKDPAERRKTGDAGHKYHAEHPEFSKRQTQRLREALKNPEAKRLWLESCRQSWNNQERRAKRSADFSAVWQNPETRKQLIDLRKQFWASGSPEFIAMRKKMIAGLNLRPNKPETVVLTLLGALFPSEWKYVGDGQIIIGGLNPDIINTNGEKLIIEVFGDYWHTQQLKPYRINEGRREVYAEYGYKTLIIWERETKKDLDKLAEKIKQFVTK